jgi:hypothetical protein
MTFSASHKLRATEIRPLATLVARITPTTQPILLYTNGTARWDYLHQMIWYTDHRAQMLTDVSQTLAQLQQASGSTLIVDRTTYQTHLLSSVNDLEVLGQSETLVCVRRSRTRPTADVCD